MPLFAKHPARRIDLAPTPRAERPAEPRTLRRKTPVGRLCRRGTGHARRPAHGRDHVQARRQTARPARTPDTGERHEPLRALRGGPGRAALPHRHRAQTVADRGQAGAAGEAKTPSCMAYSSWLLARAPGRERGSGSVPSIPTATRSRCGSPGKPRLATCHARRVQRPRHNRPGCRLLLCRGLGVTLWRAAPDYCRTSLPPT